MNLEQVARATSDFSSADLENLLNEMALLAARRKGVNMTQPIVYVDTSKIREGKFEELEMAMKKLSTFVEANVPQLISYGFYFNENRTQMTVVAIHPDSASLEFHMDRGSNEFRKFNDLIVPLRIEVYGHISDTVLGRLRQKAEILGSGAVTYTSTIQDSLDKAARPMISL